MEVNVHTDEDCSNCHNKTLNLHSNSGFKLKVKLDKVCVEDMKLAGKNAITSMRNWNVMQKGREEKSESILAWVIEKVI